MSFFSRLTDIVTCNLSEILANEADPVAAVQEIIDEMKVGLAGAERSMKTANANEERLKAELAELQAQVDTWTARARSAVEQNNEETARNALLRKSEIEDLITSLKVEHSRAEETCRHLQTTFRGLEARMSDAQRKQQQLLSGEFVAEKPSTEKEQLDPIRVDESRSQQIDDELAALKKQLGK